MKSVLAYALLIILVQVSLGQNKQLEVAETQNSLADNRYEITTKSGIELMPMALPSIGAQVFIEPGQSDQQVEGWFKSLHDNGFTSCRIRMFESYMRNAQGQWDFSLFDRAFRYADQYQIKVFATLFPNTAFNDVGGVKFPVDQDHLSSIQSYIKEMTNHFKKFKSLHAWVLINEPGLGYVPDNPYINSLFKNWQDSTKQVIASNDLRKHVMDKREFLLAYNTYFLGWIANEIQKNDLQRHLHVNNHSLFLLADEYDFPSWMNFLNSLGASIHPSWHFGFFDRDQYALAVAANNDMIRSGASGKPYWVTELQGGNNTFSGYRPMCPTAEEITQWLWTSIASGTEGIIFWSLNARAVGLEAGEWALLTNQDKNSDRMDAAANVANTLSKHKGLFEKAKPVHANVHLLYSHEAFWAEKELHVAHSEWEGRNYGAAIKSALGYYEVLHGMGIPADINEFGEFDWSLQNYKGQTIILANQIAVSDADWLRLQEFVSKGGQLLVTGQSGTYNEYLQNRFMIKGGTSDFLGAELSEYKVVGDLFDVQVSGLKLPAHMWRGELVVGKGQSISQRAIPSLGVVNNYGRGKVFWIPSLIGLGARKTKGLELSKFLKTTISIQSELPFQLSDYAKDVVFRVMKSDDHCVTIWINKGKEPIDLPFKMDKRWHLEFIESASKVDATNATIRLLPEETKIILWNQK